MDYKPIGAMCRMEVKAWKRAAATLLFGIACFRAASATDLAVASGQPISCSDQPKHPSRTNAATEPENRTFYKRAGFEVLGENNVGSNPGADKASREYISHTARRAPTRTRGG